MAIDYGDYFGTDEPMEISDICEGCMDTSNPFAAEAQAEKDKEDLEKAIELLKHIQRTFSDNVSIKRETEYLMASSWPYLCLKNCIYKRADLDNALKHKDADKTLAIVKYHADFLRQLPF